MTIKEDDTVWIVCDIKSISNSNAIRTKVYKVQENVVVCVRADTNTNIYVKKIYTFCPMKIQKDTWRVEVNEKYPPYKMPPNTVSTICHLSDETLKRQEASDKDRDF